VLVVEEQLECLEPIDLGKGQAHCHQTLVLCQHVYFSSAVLWARPLLPG
jgi:hypothetical protein